MGGHAIEEGRRLAVDWLSLWDGHLGVADGLISTDFRMHWGLIHPGNWGVVEPATSPDTLRGPAEMAAFVEQCRAPSSQLTFTMLGTPMVEEGDNDTQVALRWNMTVPGTDYDKDGIDWLRIAAGRVCEAWSVTGERRFG